jgi:hypothetical protein
MAGKGEDLLGGHLPLTSATYPADLLGCVIAVNEQAGTVLIQLEIHIAARMNAEDLADLQRNRDLSLLGDSHIGNTSK